MTLHTAGLLERLEKRLRNPLPGIPAQLRMIPEPRPGHQAYYDVEGISQKAGILLLLYPKDGKPVLLLTRRTDRVQHHRGQISFPGGEQHSGESLVDTALRETKEELGIGLEDVRVLGSLTPLYIPRSNFSMYPSVAYIPKIPRFTPQAEEVAEVLEVPLEHLTDRRHLHREVWRIDGKPLDVPFYEFEGSRIWGATAMVLAEFLALVVDPDEGGDPPAKNRS
jgi:8-oxo-dGTP pyrophosphatase MutT (NUDIX family)